VIPVRPTTAQFLRFLAGSAAGLTVDLVVFAGAVQIGAPPWVANSLSAGCAVVVVYLLATRYAFGSDRTPGGFVLFVGWYVLSILVFSVFIEVLHLRTGWPPFVCKLVSLPPSFAANFLVSRALLHRRAGEGAVRLPASTAVGDAAAE
jgi:putative flippase GtrA